MVEVDGVGYVDVTVDLDQAVGAVLVCTDVEVARVFGFRTVPDLLGVEERDRSPNGPFQLGGRDPLRTPVDVFVDIGRAGGGEAHGGAGDDPALPGCDFSIRYSLPGAGEPQLQFQRFGHVGLRGISTDAEEGSELIGGVFGTGFDTSAAELEHPVPTHLRDQRGGFDQTSPFRGRRQQRDLSSVGGGTLVEHDRSQLIEARTRIHHRLARRRQQCCWGEVGGWVHVSDFIAHMFELMAVDENFPLIFKGVS